MGEYTRMRQGIMDMIRYCEAQQRKYRGSSPAQGTARNIFQLWEKEARKLLDD